MKSKLLLASVLATCSLLIGAQIALVKDVQAGSPITSPITFPITYPSLTPSPVNLVKNPGCEVSIANWNAWHGTASRVTTVAHSGVASCQAALATIDTVYTLDDYGQTTTNVKVGETYTATAWVRSDSAVNRPVTLVLRQWKSGKSFKNFETTKMNLTSEWQKMTFSTTILDGVTGLDVYITQYNALAGDAFQADDISLMLQPEPVSSRILSSASSLFNIILN